MVLWAMAYGSKLPPWEAPILIAEKHKLFFLFIGHFSCGKVFLFIGHLMLRHKLFFQYNGV